MFHQKFGYGTVKTSEDDRLDIEFDKAGEKRVRIYMRVDDLDGYLDRAEQLGGQRLVPPTDLPGDFGRFAIFTDPDGNQVGLWS